jgi:ribonuclease BN (tRNA processing enzyme)
MECLFPGSSTVSRRFPVEVTELPPGSTATVAGVRVATWLADHPSGAPALALRVTLGGRVIAYTGDTAWTDTLIAAADGADLLIAEAYRMDQDIPYHLRHADLAARRHLLTSGRIVLTHLGADVLRQRDRVLFETARDGLVLDI